MVEYPNAHSEAWLSELFDVARDRNWCTRRTCTTCGARDFRSAYMADLLRQADIPECIELPPPHYHFSVRDLCAGLDGRQRLQIRSALTLGVRGLAERHTHEDAFRWVMLDLNSTFARRRAAMDAALSGSPARAGLQRMEDHSRRLDESYAREAEGRRLKAAEKAKRAEQRSERRAAHVIKRKELLENLAAMPALRRLTWLSEQPDNFPIAQIPIEWIRDAFESVQLPASVRVNIANRIRKRRGPWAQLRRTLSIRPDEQPPQP